MFLNFSRTKWAVIIYHTVVKVLKQMRTVHVILAAFLEFRGQSANIVFFQVQRTGKKRITASTTSEGRELLNFEGRNILPDRILVDHF